MTTPVSATSSDALRWVDGPARLLMTADDRRAMLPILRALTGRATRPVNVLCLGDSITEGYGASTLDTRYVGVLRDMLRQRYPTPGITGGAGYIAANHNTPPQSGEVFTAVGGELYPSMLYGLGRRSHRMWQAGDTLSATLDCSSFDLLYATTASGGTFTVTIDGGSPASIPTAAATHSGETWNSGPLTPGSHTVEFAWSAAGSVYIEGVMVSNGDEDAGIRVWESGFGGAKSEWYSGGSGTWSTSLAPIQPDLVVIEVGTNDWFYNTGVVSGSYGNFGPSVVRANIETTISRVRAQTDTDPSIILVAVHERTDGVGVLNPWSEYVTMYHELAAADAKVAVLDIPAIVGPAPVWPLGILDSDRIHPNDDGYALMAAGLLGMISGAGV